MADFRGDQASGLRRLLGRPPLRVITFAAGSNGVGKSTAVANLAVLLARKGREVLIVDENASTVAGSFGASVDFNLQQVIQREKRLAEVIVPLAAGIRLLPTVGVTTQLAALTEVEQQILLCSLADLQPAVDVLLVDSTLDHPLGFSPLGLAADDAVIVIAPQGPVITEAYALIKKVSLGYARRHFRILINRARSVEEAQAIYRNIAEVAHGRGLARLDYAGHVPLDDRLHQSSHLCQPAVCLFPESPAARAYQALADELLAWPINHEANEGLEQFVQQLLHLSHRIDPIAIYA